MPRPRKFRRVLAPPPARYFKPQGVPLRHLEQVVLPVAREGRGHTYNQYVVRVPRRDELRAFLADRGIGAAVYYPLPLHLQPCFAGLGYAEGDFPVAERACREVLALPVFPELTAAEQEEVVAAIASFYGRA